MAIGLLPCAGTGIPLYDCCIASLQAMKHLIEKCRCFSALYKTPYVQRII